MTAQEKEDLLKAYHPDYKEDQFEELKIGPNKGEKVPVELAHILQAHSRITADSVDLEHPDYDVDVSNDSYIDGTDGLFAEVYETPKHLAHGVGKF